jgi:hypothetical protein
LAFLLRSQDSALFTAAIAAAVFLTAATTAIKFGFSLTILTTMSAKPPFRDDISATKLTREFEESEEFCESSAVHSLKIAMRAIHRDSISEVCD